MPRHRFVLTFPTYMNEFRGCWGFTLVFLSKVVSFELDSLFWLERGVINWLWFVSKVSYCPGVLCEGSQEVLLQRSGGLVVANVLSFALESSKVGGMSQQKWRKFDPPR